MSAKFDITAERRDMKGSGASRRLRRENKVPAVLYGAAKDVILLSLDHDMIYHHLENEAFHTSVLILKVGNDSEQAILRDVQMHPYKHRVVHMDFQRISASKKIHMRVPLHFVGEDIAPGVKQEGGIVSHLMTELDVTCLPKDLPEFLTADISALNLGDSLHLSDLPLPEGVEFTSLAHGGDDLAVVAVTAVRGATIEEEEAAEAAAAEAAAEEAEAEGEGEAEAPAEEEKKESE